MFVPYYPVILSATIVAYTCTTSLANKQPLLREGTTKLFDMVDNMFGSIHSIPTRIPDYSEKRLVASDGGSYDNFGVSCAISGDLIVIGASTACTRVQGCIGIGDGTGAAYLFDLNGKEKKKFTTGEDGEEFDYFGESVAIDQKIVVGSYSGYFVRVFSRDGIYERTITCNDCWGFAKDVATLGNKIVIAGEQNYTANKLSVYSTEGELLKELEPHHEEIYYPAQVAISEQYIVSTPLVGKTFVYANEAPDFNKTVEIDQGGSSVAVFGDRLVIGDKSENDGAGAAWLYSTDGTLIKTLERHGSEFGHSVEITNNKVLVSAPLPVATDEDCGETGSLLTYSADTGDFIEKIYKPKDEYSNIFGSCVSASSSHYIVGAANATNEGAAYLFPFPL